MNHTEEPITSPWQDKLVITGTGRSGTTLMMQLFTAMGEDTGYKRHTDTIQRDANAGMERVGTWRMRDSGVARLPTIIKDPRLSLHLGKMAKEGRKPGHVLWCFRDVADVARSRFASNRPWFSDPALPDLSKIDKARWPSWATLANQERAMHEVVGTLVSSLVQHNITHTVLVFPVATCDPNRLWRTLCGNLRRGSIAEFLDWRDKGDLERFEHAWNKVVNTDLVHYGRPEGWE